MDLKHKNHYWLLGTNGFTIKTSIFFRVPLQTEGRGAMAFLGEESWKVGLSCLQVSKINDLETQLAKTRKEKNEKSVQVEILQQTIEKQKRKVQCNNFNH